MSSTAIDPSKPYQILGAPLHVRQWSDELQAVIDGWEIRARWLANMAVVRVFVPDSSDIAATADVLIRHQGDQLDKLGK
jgi:hypothetical protein